MSGQFDAINASLMDKLMSKLKFRTKEFRKVLAASVEMNRPVHIVKDDGIYVMVFHMKPSSNVIAYAIGYNPKIDGDEVWDKAREAVGGDDFGEEICTPDNAAHYSTGTDFTVEVTETHLTLSGKV